MLVGAGRSFHFSTSTLLYWMHSCLQPSYSSFPNPLQSHSDDCLRQSVRPGLHGDAEHTKVCQPSPKHQEQGGGEPRQDQPADQCPACWDSPTSVGTDGIQGGEWCMFVRIQGTLWIVEMGKKKEWGGWGMIMRNERWQVEEESEHMAVSVTDAMRP